MVFAAEPADEATVRAAIVAALEHGRVTGPTGHVSSWRLVRQAAGDVRAGERELAARLGP